METLWQDIKFGARMLAKSPGFTAIAVLSLALGIGFNSAMFGLFDAALLRSLPVPEPERLVLIDTRTTEGGLHSDFSYPLYSDLRRINGDAFEGLFAYSDAAFGARVGERTERIAGQYVSANYFSSLGVQPSPGSGFGPDDEHPGAQRVAIISHAFWKRFFDGDPNILLKTLQINGRTFSIAGVAPEGFSGIMRGLPTEVWLPLPQFEDLDPAPGAMAKRNFSWMFLAGRLKPGVTREQAESQMTARAPEAYDAAPGTKWIVTLTPADVGNTAFTESLSDPLKMLLGAVGLILAIACANVAGLLLTRAQVRQKEIGIRTALGASRARLVRQLLTESLILAVAGGALGLLFALWAADFSSFITTALGGALTLDASLNARVLLFTAAVSLLTAVLFGLVPAIRASRVDVVPVLKDASLRPPHRRLPPLRHVLVVLQVTLSLVLLIGAGLFLRSLGKLRAIDLGFAGENVVALAVDLRLQGYDEARGANLYPQLVERVASLPGVQSASLASVLPPTLGGRRMERSGNETRPQMDGSISIDMVAVAPRFFETIGLPLRGRDFRALDGPKSAKVAIVNETMAAKFWPGQDPVGGTFFDGDTTYEIVGVARNTKYRSLRETPRMTMYLPLPQDFRWGMNLLVRATGAPQDVIAAVRAEIRSLDAAMPVFGIRTLAEHVGRSLFLERMQATLLVVFGALALVLAVIGLYGVMAYTVAQRTREMGIRMALGAQRRDVLRLVIGQGSRLVLAGLLLGVAGALALTRVVQSLLFGVRAADPLTFAGVALLLSLVALGACLIPARRATRVDPAIALRYE